jgi:hypothetical protein
VVESFRESSGTAKGDRVTHGIPTRPIAQAEVNITICFLSRPKSHISPFGNENAAGRSVGKVGRGEEAPRALNDTRLRMGNAGKRFWAAALYGMSGWESASRRLLLFAFSSMVRAAGELQGGRGWWKLIASSVWWQP